MSIKSQYQVPIEELLASCSDYLFPADIGEALVTLDSRGIDGDSPLHVMVWRDDTEAVLRFIEAGADVNAVGDMSATPLHVAVEMRNLVAIEAMLKAGADPTCKSEFGHSSQTLAKEIGGEVFRIFESL